MLKKFILILFLGIISNFCYSQEFLNNPDYVYGSGYSDSVAVISLSMSIGVEVIGEISYTLKEENNIASRTFNKEQGLNYSKILRNTKSYYDSDKNIYYRYLNKTAYINKHLSKARYYEHYADSIDNCDIKHKKNLVLGYYYKAYNEINDNIFTLLTEDEYYTYSNKLMAKTRIAYFSGEYGSLFLQEKKVNGYWIVTNNELKSVGNPPVLYAFECNINGKWISPSYYTSFEGNENKASYPDDNMNFDRCYICSNTPVISYRIIYEDKNGKIDVPNSWYFCIFKIYNLRNLS